MQHLSTTRPFAAFILMIITACQPGRSKSSAVLGDTSSGVVLRDEHHAADLAVIPNQGIVLKRNGIMLSVGIAGFRVADDAQHFTFENSQWQRVTAAEHHLDRDLAVQTLSAVDGLLGSFPQSEVAVLEPAIHTLLQTLLSVQKASPEDRQTSAAANDSAIAAGLRTLAEALDPKHPQSFFEAHLNATYASLGNLEAPKYDHMETDLRTVESVDNRDFIEFLEKIVLGGDATEMVVADAASGNEGSVDIVDRSGEASRSTAESRGQRHGGR